MEILKSLRKPVTKEADYTVLLPMLKKYAADEVGSLFVERYVTISSLAYTFADSM